MGSPPAEPDDNSDPASDLSGNSEVHAHGFEKPEAEAEAEGMNIDVGDTRGAQAGGVLSAIGNVNTSRLAKRRRS